MAHLFEGRGRGYVGRKQQLQRGRNGQLLIPRHHAAVHQAHALAGLQHRSAHEVFQPRRQGAPESRGRYQVGRQQNQPHVRGRLALGSHHSV